MRVVAMIVMVSSLLVAGVGCETKGQTGALAGAGIGAIAGQAIGGSTGATLIGAAAGAGLGYVIGNEEDKKDAAEQHARKEREMSRSKVSRSPDTAYRPAPANQFVGTTWRIISLEGTAEEIPEDYASIVVTFQTNTQVTTLTTFRDGRVKTNVERYRIVEDTMVINSDDYIINARFDLHHDQLILVADDFRAVFEKV